RWRRESASPSARAAARSAPAPSRTSSSRKGIQASSSNWLEHRSPKPRVGGSNPSWPAKPFAPHEGRTRGTNEMVGSIVLLGVVAALAGLGYWVYSAGHWGRGLTFVGETKVEMKKVSFPSRDEVVATTIVVIVVSFIFAIYLWVADVLIA